MSLVEVYFIKGYIDKRSLSTSIFLVDITTLIKNI